MGTIRFAADVQVKWCKKHLLLKTTLGHKRKIPNHQFQSQFLCEETNTTHFQHKHQATAGVFMAFTFYYFYM